MIERQLGGESAVAALVSPAEALCRHLPPPARAVLLCPSCVTASWPGVFCHRLRFTSEEAGFQAG